MFGAADKSFRSVKKMKKLQPEIERIMEVCGDDKTRLDQKTMQLCQEEKVDPASGCLPLFIQILAFPFTQSCVCDNRDASCSILWMD